eukprot:29139-Chlamydomonas_euryale.AAC.3
MNWRVVRRCCSSRALRFALAFSISSSSSSSGSSANAGAANTADAAGAASNDSSAARRLGASTVSEPAAWHVIDGRTAALRRTEGAADGAIFDRSIMEDIAMGAMKAKIASRWGWDQGVARLCGSAQLCGRGCAACAADCAGVDSHT